MELLHPRKGEKVLDVGCGQGVLAPFIGQTDASYVGVDASETMIRLACRHHGKWGRFLVGDGRHLAALPELCPGGFDAAVFLLSIQNMEPLEEVLRSAGQMLKQGGRLVLMMLHPCFRLPRQSGWGWDQDRRLQYRRVDRYLTPFFLHIKVPLNDRTGTIISFHRPLENYINGLAEAGLMVSQIQEIPVFLGQSSGPRARAETLAYQEIPLFLGIKAVKIG
jgi:ubiquinone/menaquinone biosynthesis C-methylase UbiE